MIIDKATNKEQKITITNSSNLSESDIDRMVKEAEANAEADKKHKEEAEIKNNANSLISSAERIVKDFEGKISKNRSSFASRCVRSPSLGSQPKRRDDAIRPSVPRM